MCYTAIIILLVSEAFLNYTVIVCKREKNKSKQLDMVVHTCNSGTQEKEPRESGAHGHLYDFKVSLGYVARTSVKTKIKSGTILCKDQKFKSFGF